MRAHTPDAQTYTHMSTHRVGCRLPVTLKRNGGNTYWLLGSERARPRGVVSSPCAERREGGGSGPRSRDREGGVAGRDGKNRQMGHSGRKFRLAPVPGAKSGPDPVKRWRQYARRRRKKCGLSIEIKPNLLIWIDSFVCARAESGGRDPRGGGVPRRPQRHRDHGGWSRPQRKT